MQTKNSAISVFELIAIPKYYFSDDYKSGKSTARSIHRHAEELLGKRKLEKVDSEDRIVADVNRRKCFKKQLNKKNT